MEADGFDTENDARRAIVEACLRMPGLGIDPGGAGSVSVRWDRGGAPGMLLTPAMPDFERMREDDVVWLSLELHPAAGDQAWSVSGLDSRSGIGHERRPAMVDAARSPAPEWRLHRDVHAARSDAVAVIHAQPVHATALACLPDVQRDGIPAFHHRVAVAGGADIRCARHATSGTAELAANALAALHGRRACLLASHGLLAFHGSLAHALRLAVEVEALCRVYLQALSLGKPAVIDPAAMACVAARLAGDAGA